MKKIINDSAQTDELIISRPFELPAEIVWKAWTKPALFKKWWGPNGYSCPYCKMNLIDGGKYLHCMQSPKGKNIWNTGTYLEIIPQKKLVFTGSFTDEKGNLVSGSYYGLDDFPMETLTIVTFNAIKSGTDLTVQQDGLPGDGIRDQILRGWNESFDKLAEKLKKRTQWS